MLALTKSYISLSVLKQMLACHVCHRRVQNPHSYSGCEEHFFCFSCKGDGAQCPVCLKSIDSSKLMKDSFLNDILKTSCFTTHDKDFERDKVPIHLANQLFKELERIDKLHLDEFASKNRLSTPLKATKEDIKQDLSRKIPKPCVTQTKLNFTSNKRAKSLDTNLNLQRVSKISDNSAQNIKPKKDGIARGRPQKSYAGVGSKTMNSSVIKSFENDACSDVDAIEKASERKSLPSGASMKEKLVIEQFADSQSVFMPQKSPKKTKRKSSNDFGKIAKLEMSLTESKSEVQNGNPVSEHGAKKKQSKQSLDLNTSDTEKSGSSSKRQSKDNADKSILEKDKKSKNAFKKNAKGETALHIACRTNKINQLKELLETDWKHHINDKDFAGWTPLHEAVTSGNYEAAKMLLEAGAWVFVPGYQFETPLHTAMHWSEELVKLILSYGPDVDARTASGQTPLSIAKELGVEHLLKDYERKNVDLPSPPRSNPALIYVVDGNSSNKSIVASLRKLNLPIANNFSKEISHMIVQTNDNNCESSMIVLEAVLTGKFLLSSKWVDDSAEKGEILDCELYEVSGIGSHAGQFAPYKARLNAFRLLPGLFAGGYFYLAGNWRDSTKREKITRLINSGEGLILKREPDPENIPSNESTVMYHAKPDSTMGACSHILLYNEESDGPKLKYRMNHVKTLPLKWLIACIETFSIIDPV